MEKEKKVCRARGCEDAAKPGRILCGSCAVDREYYGHIDMKAAWVTFYPKERSRMAPVMLAAFFLAACCPKGQRPVYGMFGGVKACVDSPSPR